MNHARSSVRKYAGTITDYIQIHEFMDDTKKTHATVAHRMIFHNAYGIWLVEKVFGREITNSAGIQVSVRGIAEDHVIEDLGYIPSLDEWCKEIKLQPWMAGAKTRSLEFVD